MANASAVTMQKYTDCSGLSALAALHGHGQVIFKLPSETAPVYVAKFL